jgi:hypothetical protein
MRWLAFLLLLGFTLPGYLGKAAAKPAKGLVPPPTGATLPIRLIKTLKSQSLTAGQPITARFFQRVPVSPASYLPSNVEIDGHVVQVGPSSLSILFTELRWKGQTVPVHVRLVAAASLDEVFQTEMPLAAADRGDSNPADWTTRQVGGDEVYRSAGAGKVYDQYSEPVGFADLNGVYQDPSGPGTLPHAMGPFSTTVGGLHGFVGFTIISSGDATSPITFGVSKPKWTIARGGAFLLEVIP